MPTTADIQAAEIHFYFQGNALFQPVRDSSHETPRCLAQKWEDGCRAGSDRAIIRLPRPDSAARKEITAATPCGKMEANLSRMRHSWLENSASLNRLWISIFSPEWHSLSEPAAHLLRAKRAAAAKISDFAGETQVPSCQFPGSVSGRSEEHTSELQSHLNLVCRLLLEKKNNHTTCPYALPHRRDQ